MDSYPCVSSLSVNVSDVEGGHVFDIIGVEDVEPCPTRWRAEAFFRRNTSGLTQFTSGMPSLVSLPGYAVA